MVVNLVNFTHYFGITQGKYNEIFYDSGLKLLWNRY